MQYFSFSLFPTRSTYSDCFLHSLAVIDDVRVILW